MSDDQARFYFMNLAADAARTALAAEEGNDARYAASLARARSTLLLLRDAPDQAAYKEGALMLDGLELAREDESLPQFRAALDSLVVSLANR